MKNADKPTYPLEFKKEGSYNTEGWSNGLTKREYFAGLAMQGLLTLPKVTYGSFDEAIERICEVSVKFADELLKQLEEK